MKALLLILALVVSVSLSLAQSTGSLSGRVFDSNLKSSLPGAQVYIETINGKQGTVTNIDGYFTIKPIKPGRYNLTITFVGYQKYELTNVEVRPEFETKIDDVVLMAGVGLPPVIITYKPPMIDPYNGTIVTMDPRKTQQLPDKRDIMKTISLISTEFYVSENNNEIHFRGSRDDMTAYIVDGIRVDGLGGIPGSAIGNMTVYAGGIPARYGDFTGGVIVVETMGYFDWLKMQQYKDMVYDESLINE